MNKVKAVRLRKQISRYRLSQMTGISYSALMAIENGGDIKISTLAKIAKVLNVEVIDLV